ncbi:MAG: hypothetical protein L6U99_09235 [Clostridium sp.]|nr:MAG: hypothetical protein L6U99_09235 [Clostridium sp.]
MQINFLKVRDNNLNSLTLSRNDSVDGIFSKISKKSPYELLKLNEKKNGLKKMER